VSLLSDELVEQLIAVGQVDVLVGVPTLDNASTVGPVVSAIHRSFAIDLWRERTVLLNCDGGSKDGTPDVVRGASLRDDETLIASQSLRTIHRITAPYHGLPGKGAALRTLFAAAELLQARVVAVFDPDVTSLTQDWVARLVRPVLNDRAAFVAPVFARQPSEGLLVTQLVRPLFRAAYGFRVREPLASEFACSGAFASHCLAEDVWEKPLARYGIDLWLTGAALSGGFACAEARLGRRVLGPGAPRPALPEIFRQVVGSLFACLEAHAPFWLPRDGSSSLPVFGTELDVPTEPVPADPLPMIDAFRAGARDLAPILDPVLGPELAASLAGLVESGSSDFRFEDSLWASAVIRAVAAYKKGALHREHLVQALVPLYLGRAASFLLESAESAPPGVEQRLEELCLEFESRKPQLVDRWTGEK
jgi:hypothetical protein